ncbi:hypothetical protein F4779DRAFT_620104 [Xylariaceae sp. FL0662B]|nr:hypothetical protein F4779DRAFT_620104 [Xylariaceae sp. FL0662B]
MCKQYDHYRLCRRPQCNTILGKKTRNRYCREALDARRLGHCSTGVRVAGQFHARGAFLCAQCKMPSPQTADIKESDDATTNADAAARQCKGKVPSVFEYAFEIPLELEEKGVSGTCRARKA